jgi:phosphosulfolactate synthase
MNLKLPYLPERTTKDRDNGITMMMDKGLSLMEAESFIQSSAEFTDLVKFGFGTAIINNHLKEKVQLYKKAGLKPYTFRAFYYSRDVRGIPAICFQSRT